ncbi:MAG: hypothetical protein IMZ55_19690 [Acidobacteria bacterium]|nr:hypothetical protein [Acidobacteriota bacterium]
MVKTLIAAVERRPGRTIAAVGLLIALAYGSALVLLPKRDGRIVVGDAGHYYVYLRSAVFDRDLHFRNDYIRLYGLKGGEEDTEWVYRPTATGHVRNMMAIGVPILWAPLFLCVTLGVAAARLFGSAYPLDGFGAIFQASAGFSGILAATIGAWLTWRLVARLYGARIAIWSTLAVWLGSSAIYYSMISPTYSHAASMLVLSAFFFRWATSFSRQTCWRFAQLGSLIGLATLVRWQDAVFLIVPFVDVIWHARVVEPGRPARVNWQRIVLNLAACGVAWLAVFSPQIGVWMVLYGQPLAMPQGSEWMQWGNPRIAAVLFSDWHGLFTWTPIIAVAAIGLVPLWQRDRLIATGMIAALLVSVYANAAVIEWWAGEAYGSRRFVSCFPIFVMGFAALVDRARTHPLAMAALGVTLVVLNGLLLFQYQLFMHGMRTVAPYPRGAYNLLLARFVTPFKLIGWWWSS